MAKAARKKKKTTGKKVVNKLNPRVGTSISLIPGLRLYVSYGKSGAHFNLGGSPKRIIKGLKSAFVDHQSKKLVDEEAEQLTVMLDEEDKDGTALAKDDS